MLCPKCKNPIENNAAVCEWCGFVLREVKEKPKQENTISEPLNEEILSLCKQGRAKEAIFLHQKNRGTSFSESKRYVTEFAGRMIFFQSHKFATETEWEKEFSRRKLKYVKTQVLAFILIILIPVILFFSSALFVFLIQIQFNPDSHFEEITPTLGLVFIFLILIVDILIIFYGVKKIKKMLNFDENMKQLLGL